jgi:heme/copper-type cytochrome/quinol oxidase subunit 3
MYALPPAPAAPPRRQVFIGTAVGSVAAMMLIGGMLAVYIRIRQQTLGSADDAVWVPDDITIPEVPVNVMLISFFTLCLFAQWAVYAARRRDRPHVGLALGLVALIGLAIINAQGYIYNRMELPIGETAFAGMFYAVTGAMLALVIIGVAFTAVAAFRVLGGREADTEIVAAHALYWYVLSAVFSALWLIVYVTR